MKKILLFVLGITLLLSMAGGVSGVTITQDDSQSMSATVTLLISNSYTVSIPSAFSIAQSTGTGQDTINGQVFNIPATKNLTVTVSSDNFGLAPKSDTEKYTQAWAMKYSDSDHDEYVPYMIGSYDSENDHIPGGEVSPVQKGGVVLDLPASASDNALPTYKYLHFKLVHTDADYAGTYVDQLTFTVSLTDNQNLSSA